MWQSCDLPPSTTPSSYHQWWNQNEPIQRNVCEEQVMWLDPWIMWSTNLRLPEKLFVCLIRLPWQWLSIYRGGGQEEEEEDKEDKERSRVSISPQGWWGQSVSILPEYHVLCQYNILTESTLILYTVASIIVVTSSLYKTYYTSSFSLSI